ncbi:MAG TPA: DUF5335 family protein [Terriglobales bacterium]|nr:DUF5335 family protein [Terriglobales bacterium]
MNAVKETSTGPTGSETLTREVPRQEWPAFFQMFSRQHQAWLVTVELFGREIGAQVEVQDRPLGGITAELRRDRGDSIVLSFGTIPSDLTHIVRRPTRVWLKQTISGADQALEIECESGPTTLVRFRSPMLLETVDDFLAWGQ